MNTTSIEAAAGSVGALLPNAAAYFEVAGSPRFRVSQRSRMRAAARSGMLVVAAAAIADCVWLVPVHPEAGPVTVGLNAVVALIAMTLFIAMSAGWRRYPEVAVFTILVVVDAATLALATADHDLSLFAAAYLLLLPTVVALLIPWPTRVHTAWLVLHGTAAMSFAILVFDPSFPGASAAGMLALLIVASVVSQFGHVSALRARVLSFVQIERIRALNRQARRDAARLDRLNRLLEQAATTDELTGLKNRLSLKQDLDVLRSRMSRHGDHYAVLMIDLDRFKAINDGLGHLGGDRVLQVVAGAVVDAIRPEDGAYRYGGEEFVVLMRIDRRSDAGPAGERIRRAVEALGIAHPGNPPHRSVTVCIGVTTVAPEDLAYDDETWLARADAALYRAKALGRNRCEIDLRSGTRSDLSSDVVPNDETMTPQNLAAVLRVNPT